MATQFAIFSAPSGTLLADYSNKIQDLTVSTGPRGFAECSGFIPMGLAQAFLLYDRAGLPHVVFTDNAADTVYTGRLEDVRIVSTGVHVRAFGYARAFSDVPYTAMWSVSSLEDFEPDWLANTTQGPTTNRYFDINDDNGTITIGLVKNSIEALNTRAHMFYRIPSGSSRNIAGYMVDYSFAASANVTMRVSAWTSAYPFGGSSSNLSSLVGNGANQTGILWVGANTPVISFGLEITTLHTYTGETGAEYVEFSNLRLVGNSANGIL